MKLKFQLSEKISKFEALLSQKEKYDENATGKEIIEKKRIEEKLVDIESEFQKDIKNLEQELKAQKKKSNKFYDIEQKEKMINLLKEKINILEKKYKGEDVDESEVKNNESMIQSLDDFLKKSKINELIKDYLTEKNIPTKSLTKETTKKKVTNQGIIRREEE